MPKFTYDKVLAKDMGLSFDDTYNGTPIRFYDLRNEERHFGYVFGVAPVSADIDSPSSLWREIMGNEEPSDYMLVMVGFPYIYSNFIDRFYSRMKKRLIDFIMPICPATLLEKIMDILDYYDLSELVVSILPRNPMMFERSSSQWSIYGLMPEKVEYHNKTIETPFITSDTEDVLSANILKLKQVTPKEIKHLFKHLEELEVENKELKMKFRMVLKELGTLSKYSSVIEKVGITQRLDTAMQGEELSKILLNKIEGGISGERRRPEPDEEERDR